MADFCKQCSEDVFHEDAGDLAGLVPEGDTVSVLCEGCGPCMVDHTGECQGGCIKRSHNKG